MVPTQRILARIGARPPVPGCERRLHQLQGRTAVIVGAGQVAGETVGNGRAAALAYAREGARVFLVDRDAVSCNETAAMVRDQGGQADTFTADISHETECAELALAAITNLGRVDVLHNNVAKATGDGGTLELTESNLHAILHISLAGMLLTIKHFLPQMRAQRSGCIINVSSIGSVCTLPAGGGGGFAYKVAFWCTASVLIVSPRCLMHRNSTDCACIQ